MAVRTPMTGSKASRVRVARDGEPGAQSADTACVASARRRAVPGISPPAVQRAGAQLATGVLAQHFNLNRLLLPGEAGASPRTGRGGS